MHIHSWQLKFAEMYHNEGKSPDYIMVHLSTKCSELARLFHHNKAHYMKTDLYIIKALSWLMAMCNHFDINYEMALIRRFPGKCPYCLSAPCCCLETKKAALDKRSGRALSDEEVDLELKYSLGSFVNSGVRLSFDDFREMILRIYPLNKAFIQASFWAMPLGKLDEEKGELHKAYSAFLMGKSSVEEISTEIADMTAWLISFWDYHKSGKGMDSEISSYFRNGCPSCNETVCVCPSYSISKGEEELLREIIGNLRSIRSAGIVEEKQIDDVTSLAKIAREGGEPGIRQQLFDGLAVLRKMILAAPELSAAVAGSLENIDKAARALKELMRFVPASFLS